MRRAATWSLAAAFAATAVFATAAHSREPTGNIVADAFLRTLEQNGYQDVTTGTVTRDSGETVLAGISAKNASGAAVTIEEVTIQGGLINADNELRAEVIVYTDLQMDDPAAGGQSSVGKITVTAPRFPVGVTSDVALTSFLGEFDALALESVAMAVPDGGDITVKSMTAEVSERDLAVAASGKFAVDDFILDVSMMDPEAVAQLNALGYDALTIDLSGDARWEAQSGRATVSDLSVSVVDLGGLSLIATIDGLTPENVTALSAGVNDFNQLLTVLQSVTVGAMTLTYEDDGLTNRVLDATTKQTGEARQTLVDGLLTALSQATGTLGDADLEQSVQTAARTFLNDPGTIELNAAPAAPIPMAQLIGAAMMSPQMVPQLLNLTITARP
ncbi:MAG: hypothetical protein AAGD34_18610 [Pseudomonadota bacterium]